MRHESDDRARASQESRSLDDLAVGASGTLVRLGGDRSFRRRLLELGLLPGTPVRLVRRAKLGGVLELEVRRCRLTLRSLEAQQLYVRPEGAV